MYKITYIHRRSGEKYEKTVYADDINEASRIAERNARTGYLPLFIVKDESYD
jgi:hypothetical protein